MDIMIDEKAIEEIKFLLLKNNKTAIRLAPIGYAWCGPILAPVLDEQKDGDIIEVIHGISIVTRPEFVESISEGFLRIESIDGKKRLALL